jgi:hypothetical protein
MNLSSCVGARRKTPVILMAAAWAMPAWAGNFDLGDGWTGSWSSSVSLGSAWRAAHRDSRLYGQADGALIGLTDGTGANTIDVGNLNYDKGDRFTTLLKWIGEVELKKGDFGALVRAKAWYDDALSNSKVALGSQNNGYNNYVFSPTGGSLGERKPLSDEGFERLSKFKGVYLLDAYAYNTFDVGGLPLQIRAGNQVVNWGESLFIQGLNQINPIDVPSFRKPGAQLKEVFLPVPIVFASQSLGQFGSVEGFWQAQWKNTPIEAGCGNYWAVAGGNISAHPGKCNSAVTLAGSEPFGLAVNAYVPTVEGKAAKNSGEFGMAYRFNSERLDTEFGFYGMQIHSRTPIVSLRYQPTGTASPFAALWEYPENMKLFGVSAATNILGWSVGAELSHTRDVPVQIDGNDLLLSGLAAGGVIPGLPAGTAFGPNGTRAAAAFAGDGYVAGFTRANKTQLQLNTVKAGNRILGAGQYVFIGEVAYQTNNLPDYKKDPTALRYNRPFIFGAGSHPTYGGDTCNPAAPLNVPGAEGCANDGYVSKNAWGYRLKAELTYNDLLPGVAVQPSLYWAHDVQGYSLDSQFSQGRRTLALATRFSYAKKYTFELGGVHYNRDAKYDPLRDRAFVYANAGLTF